jgi:hypothetical protein
MLQLRRLLWQGVGDISLRPACGRHIRGGGGADLHYEYMLHGQATTVGPILFSDGFSQSYKHPKLPPMPSSVSSYPKEPSAKRILPLRRSQLLKSVNSLSCQPESVSSESPISRLLSMSLTSCHPSGLVAIPPRLFPVFAPAQALALSLGLYFFK